MKSFQLMSGFKIGPLPCRNPDSFSKLTKKTEAGKKQKPVIHRNVEGENNGKCYKIKGPITPFILNHLEKNYKEDQQYENKKNSSPRPNSSAGNKRERESSDSDDQLEDANRPSSSSQVCKKRQRSLENQ